MMILMKSKLLVISKDWGVRSMSPGSLSFAKLVMMSSVPANPAGKPDTCPKIHSFNQHCPIQSRLQSVLGERSFYVERNTNIN